MEKHDNMVKIEEVLAILDKVTDNLMLEDAADGFDSGYNNGICAVYGKFVDALLSMNEKKIDE